MIWKMGPALGKAKLLGLSSFEGSPQQHTLSVTYELRSPVGAGLYGGVGASEITWQQRGSHR